MQPAQLNTVLPRVAGVRRFKRAKSRYEFGFQSVVFVAMTMFGCSMASARHSSSTTLRSGWYRRPTLGSKRRGRVFRRSGISPSDVDTVVAGNMAQTSFDAYVLPRHIALYSGVPIEVPAHLVQRVCGTGIEAILQAADAIKLGKAELALVVGAESMSRNPIAAYTHRSGFRMGEVEFKDFLWEALLDPSCNTDHGRDGREAGEEVWDHSRRCG